MLPRLPVGKMFHATALLLAMSWPAFSQPSPAPSLTGDALGGNVKPVVIVPDAGKYAWLGFEVSRADEAVRAQLPKLPKGMGFIISKVEASGPARSAGVEAMDVLWKFNDQYLINEAQLAVLLQFHKAGDVVELTLFRGGEEKKLPVTLGTHPGNRNVAAGPTIASIAHPTAVPRLEPQRPLDGNTRIARLEDGNAVVEMEMRAEGPWLSITNQEGASVFAGFVNEKSEKNIPEIWHERVEALRRTLQNRTQNGTNLLLPKGKPAVQEP